MADLIIRGMEMPKNCLVGVCLVRGGRADMAKHEYISREAAIDAVDVGNLHHGIIDALQAIISDIPTADVRPVVRAVWLAEKDGVGICSNCKRLDHIDPLATHCRYCGADMREVRADG